MNIALDVMGGDHGPGELVAGAIEAARIDKVAISLVGRPDLIEAELANHVTNGLKLSIVPATQIIGMEDKPANAVRTKTDSSIVVACRMVRSWRSTGHCNRRKHGRYDGCRASSRSAVPKAFCALPLPFPFRHIAASA